jgi:mannose-6-phosphate isomerase-like protein (cupin superfamily)
MPAFNEDILRLARENPHFLDEVVTNEFTQVVLMNIQPYSDIGEEVHEVDQVLVIVEGAGEVVMNRRHSPVQADSLVVVPAGTRHNVINTGTTALKLYTLFAPPAQAPGTLHQTKAEAVAAEAAAEEDAVADGKETRIIAARVDRSNGHDK